jgi:type IV pilus assembly protein PilY1
MKQRFRINAIKFALCLAYPAFALPALAQTACDAPDAVYSPDCEGPVIPPTVAYPAGTTAYSSVPPTLEPAVKPNILLHVDNSGSMGSAATGADGKSSTRIAVAKAVATELVTKNRDLNWGLFSFDFGGNSANTDANYYNEGGVLQRPVLPIDSAHEANFKALTDTIDKMTDKTNTPLGEAMVEMTRVWAGEPSYYLGSGTAGTTSGTKVAKGKSLNIGSNGRYESPIKYRCQRNFNIVITDGDPTQEGTHAGVTDQYVPGPIVKDSSNSDGKNNGANLKYTDGIWWKQRDVANGPLLPKNFNVCKDKNTVSFVSCDPIAFAAASGTSRSPTNGGAVQDAALYAYKRDFKVDGIDGVDGDGKSWDDPKYLKQNVVTYTVGFATSTATISSAAQVGGGKYYTATDQATLTSALNNAVSEIGNITSNAGGAAANGASLSTVSQMFQPLFHPTGWYGELLCFKLDANGNQGAACTPNAGAVFPAYASRNIMTAKEGSGGATKFAFTTGNKGSMSAGQQSALGATTTEQDNVINYIRGQNITNYRSRPNGLLGDIIDSQPLVVGIPSGQTADSAYVDFKKAYNSRGVVYIGANDGMLHAFATSDMTEIFGFVPSPVYPKLKTLTAPDYGASIANPHAYHVNGLLRQQDLKLGGSWITLLVGGLGQGGQGFFALNATNPTDKSTAADLIQWEFTDKNDKDSVDLGYTFGAPIIDNARTSATGAVQVVLLPNGYKNDFPDGAVGVNKSALFIVNAADGTLRQKITAPSGWGLSSPAAVDFPIDGVIDYVYAGDQSGRLWRFDLTASSGIVPVPQLVFAAGTGHPIIQRPVIQVVKGKDGKFLGNLILFGTGSLLDGSDRLDNTTQTLYGVFDRVNASGDLGSIPLGRADLAQRFVQEAVVSAGTAQIAGTYRRIYPANPDAPALDLLDPNSSKLGWFLDLPVLSERLAAPPYLLTDRVLFGTGIPNSQEVCNTGYGWLMGLDPLTGLTVKGARGGEIDFYDVTLDGKSTAADQVRFASGNYFISGVKLNGIPTSLLVVFKSITYGLVAADSPFAAIAATIARQDSNTSGVFDGVSVGDGQRSRIVECMVGSPDCVSFTSPRAASGVRVETSTWREVK